MAWVKVPPEHHPIFLAALPTDRRITTMQMFGGIAAKANGNMFCGLFGRSAIVRLSDADQAEALALDGAQMFEPMGDGRVSKHTVHLPESIMDEPDELTSWLRRALDHALTLPPKRAEKPTKKAVAKKAVPKKQAAARKAVASAKRRSSR